ncbi:barstar family protein [Miniimonas sp. S16]|uniref:barstar family protein n=1 Tax=Miniimonas sp. S16 TaxID=2171623 RepID=UPI000D5263D8|nr:barstar family protein [Miniimonas sp. S16]
MTELVIDGARIDSIADLYDQLDDLLMTGEDWRMGASLDALNDVLYGGFGTLARLEEAPTFVWRDFAHSREALGVDATIAWWREKIARPGFDVARAQAAIRELEAGAGPTYADLVLEVFADHPRYRLELA